MKERQSFPESVSVVELTQMYKSLCLLDYTVRRFAAVTCRCGIMLVLPA